MSLLGFIGKAASVVGSTIIGGPAAGIATATTVFTPTSGSTAPVNAGPISPSSTVLGKRPVLKSNNIVASAPSVLSSLPSLPLPDSVVVQGGGTTIGPGGSLFSTGSGSATAYFSPQGTAVATCGTGMRGTHLNKTTYRTLDGTLVPKGTRCVKNRRRNPLNPRALTRAISRVSAAKSFARVLDRVEIKARPRRR